jgi:molybdate transport system substrate-binding protein
MKKIVSVAFVAAACAALAAPAGAQEVQLHGGGHFQGAGQPLVEAFTAMTGTPAAYTPGNTGDGGFRERLDAGAEIDVIVLNRADMDRQIEAGLIRPGSDVDFAIDGYGVATRKGAPVPDISTPEQLREVFLNAKAVGRRAPDPDSNSGRISQQVLIDLGILDQMQDKSVYITDPTSAIESADADFVIWSYTEILRAPEIENVGPLPRGVGEYVTQAVAIPASAKNVSQAEAFISFLTSPDGAAVFDDWGMQPVSDD